MNRHERRARAAQQRAAERRTSVIEDALMALAASASSATGATVILPTGESIYIDRATADEMARRSPPEMQQ